MVIAYNICYLTGGRTLNKCPEIVDCNTFNDFSKYIRESVDELWRLSEQYYIPPSLLYICLTFQTNYTEDDCTLYQIKIMLINVREYRQKWETVYGKKYVVPTERDLK